MTVTIAHLPIELLVKFILNLDSTSILRLQQVNKTFDEIIREHVAVRYHLELGISGLVDVAHLNNRDAYTATTTTTDERLRRLKSYNAGWRNLDFFSFPSSLSPSSDYGSTTPVTQTRGRRVTHVPKLAGSAVWELAGGVLGQGVSTTNVNERIGRSGVRKLMFTRLSVGGVRMLEPQRVGDGDGDGDGGAGAREGGNRGEGGGVWTWRWTHEGYEFPIRDFTMDPSQDLLVLLRESTTGSVGVGLGLGLGNITNAEIGNASGDSEYPQNQNQNQNQNVAEVHLRSLRTNEPHPLAKHTVFEHGLHGGTRGRSHSMQICQDKLAVLHEARAGHFPEKLVVYDWKKGEMLFDISFCGIMSFAFLTSNHLLFAVQPFNVLPACQGDHQPRLLICDIERTKALSASSSSSSSLSSSSSSSSSSSASASDASTANPPLDASSYAEEGRQKRRGNKGRGKHVVEAYVALAEFHLPELKQYADVTDITIRVDPPPPPSPPSSFSFGADGIVTRSDVEPVPIPVPIAAPAFTPAPQSRLFVITLHVETVLDDTGDHRASEHVAVGIFVPLRTFLAFLPSSSSTFPVPQGKENESVWEWENGREPEIIPSNSDDEAVYFGDFYARHARRIAVPWREWMQPSPSPSPSSSSSSSPSSLSRFHQSASGHHLEGHLGVRALLLPGAIGDTVWVCNVSGTRCVYALEPRDVVVPLAPRRVAVYEFGEGIVGREACVDYWEKEEEEEEGDGLTLSSTSSLVYEPPAAPSSTGETQTRPQNDSEGGREDVSTRSTSSSSLSSSHSHSHSSSRPSSSSSTGPSYASRRRRQKGKSHVETILTPSTIPSSVTSSTPDADNDNDDNNDDDNNNNDNNNGGIGVFDEDVTTSLPYRRTILREKKRFDGVMMTEDSLVFVSHRAPREYEVWTI